MNLMIAVVLLGYGVMMVAVFGIEGFDGGGSIACRRI